MEIIPIKIYSIDKEQTVAEFLAENVDDPKFTAYKFLYLELVKSTIGSKITNLERIRGQYTKEEIEESDSKTFDQVIIKVGTEVGLPNSSVKIKTNRTDSRNQRVFDLTSFKPFLTEQLARLLRDPNYNSYIKDIDGQSVGRTDLNEVTVFAWIRSLTDAGDNSQNGTWVNLSPFVESLQTTVTAGGGAFTIQLSPIAAEYLNGIVWGYEDVVEHNAGVISAFGISEYKNKSDNFYRRKNSFINTVMQENDLIYIRFERLAMEDRIVQGALWGSDIPGKVYDMIGLVDVVNASTNMNSVSTIVQGRDLMKMLIEDGSYVFPEHLLANMFVDSDSVLTRRNLLDSFGKQLNGVTTFKPIDIILKYIFNKFSNIGIVPSYVLNGYGSRAIQSKYELKSSALIRVDTQIQEELSRAFLDEKREGLWRISEFVFDPNASERILADSTIATDQGSIINSINKFCQRPFVEFSGDTYGDKYYFSVRKPPFDKIGYTGMVYDNIISDGGGLDAGISNNDRILDRQKSESLSLRANEGVPSQISKLVISIDEADVNVDSLSYHNDEAYSWYRLVPNGLGISDVITSLKLCPVIALDDYAKVWGNKCWDMEYNYTPIEFVDDSSKNDQTKYVVDQVFLDLKYVIDSHCYLPFTRKGTITITGNRTIKRGTFIYYKPTDEVFYVDSVTNSRTMKDRTTTLQVSRGMREKFIRGVDINFQTGRKSVSYFNIVKTEVKTNSLGQNEFLKEWKADSDIFNFFLQRRQWVEE